MRIANCLSQDCHSFSFEFFPPKNTAGVETLFGTIANLQEMAPSFVSVTYGAGGSTRDLTIALVERIKRETGLEAMAHLTCVGHGRTEIAAVLQRLRDAGVENVLALRGDPPKGTTTFVRAEDGFGYGSELVAFIRENFDFCLGSACYPEGHVESADRSLELQHLKAKVSAGADFLITQLFFDNDRYFDFVRRVRAEGITVPIIPGIMPVTNVAQLERFTGMCGASIAPALRARLDKCTDDESVIQAGIEYATEQCRDLLQRGAPGIHFYTLNKSLSTMAVMRNLVDIRGERGPAPKL